MNFAKSLLAAAAVAASFGAGATVMGSTFDGSGGTFLTLSGPMGAPGACTAGNMCTLGGVVGSIVGGTTYHDDQPFADIPAGGVFGGDFLASGPSSTSPSTLTFSTALSYVSFLWGSPDLYNTLTVKSTDGSSEDFTAAGMGFSQTNGNQSFSQYVQFVASAGTSISSLVFSSPSTDAFEVANFSVTPVPEPETYALMLAGLGALGFISRRRKRV